LPKIVYFPPFILDRTAQPRDAQKPLDQIRHAVHCHSAMKTIATTYPPMCCVSGCVIAARNRWYAIKRSTGTQEGTI